MSAHMSKRFVPIALLATTSLTSPAWADLTAEEVWSQWVETTTQTMGPGFIPGAKSQAGNTLTVTDTAFEFSDTDVSIYAAIPEITFSDQGDGTVAIGMSDTIPTTIEVTEDGETVTLPIDIKSSALNIVASGEIGAITTDYTAQSLTMEFGEIAQLPDSVELSMLVGLSNITGQSITNTADTISASGTMTAETMTYDIKVNEPSEGNLDFTFVGNGLSIQSSNTYPADFDSSDPAMIFSNPDFGGAGTLSLAGSSMNFDFKDPEMSGSGSITAGPGRVNVALEDGGVLYAGGAQDIAMNVQSSDLPVPLNLGFGEYGYRFRMPLTQSDEVKPFGLGLALRDVVIDPFLWNLFDPGEVLPRDPATIAFDLDGLGKWDINIMDPEAAEQMEEIPGEITEATLSNLRVAAAGAELTGGGRFTFDFSDLITFDGAPRPEGSLDLSLVGGNGLLDKLTQMGLLPQEQAMGARMMMGLFMTPGDAPDTLNSTIEVNSEGHVLANGQRLR